MAGDLLPWALAWCLLALAWQVGRVLGMDRRQLHAAPAGSASAGVRYAFTGAMAPGAKESVRRHRFWYGAGLLLHAGTASAFLGLAWPTRAGALLCLAGAAAGAALLGKRLFHAELRGLSHPDDFLSNALVTLLAAAGAVAPWFPQAAPWAALAVLVWAPLGKLRHSVFFFVSRAHLGAFLGRRGSFPPARV